MHVGELHQQCRQFLAAGGQAELAGLLHRVDGVADSIRKSNDLRLAGLGLQQERGEVRCAGRVAHRAQHLAALRLHHRGRVVLQCMAEGVIGGDEEPGVLLGAQQCQRRAVGQRPGVVGPVHGVRRALFTGQHRGARTGGDERGLAAPHGFLHGERHR